MQFLGPTASEAGIAHTPSRIEAAKLGSGSGMATAGSAALTPWGHSPMGKKNSIQIRHARLNYLAVGLKLKLNGPSDLILVTYPT